eukprot:6175069-Pleurochrysis_carterae.AAC.4
MLSFLPIKAYNNAFIYGLEDSASGAIEGALACVVGAASSAAALNKVCHWPSAAYFPAYLKKY